MNVTAVPDSIETAARLINRRRRARKIWKRVAVWGLPAVVIAAAVLIAR